MFYLSRYRRAFTLIELLVVIAILGIIASMLAVALSGAQRQAKDTRTKGLIDRLNLTVLNIYEQETRRRAGGKPNLAMNAQTHALSLLMWKRDWLRCAMPDRKQDLVDGPIFVQYPLVNASVVPMPDNFVRLERLGRYRQRILRNYQALNPAAPPATWVVASNLWTEEHQSAECLYLILGSGVINGVSALQTLNDRDIGDTDGDGMPEILDAWGVPVGFMRWPVGLYLTTELNKIPTDEEIVTIKRKLGRESLDIVYSDPRYRGASTATVNHDLLHPFNVFPIVVSAGADGAFDLYGLDSDASGSPPNFSYAAMQFTPPLVPANFNNPLPYVDPYLSGTLIAQQLGARQDTTQPRVNNSSDNVYPSLSFQ